jgi:hypothetical protein
MNNNRDHQFFIFLTRPFPISYFILTPPPSHYPVYFILTPNEQEECEKNENLNLLQHRQRFQCSSHQSSGGGQQRPGHLLHRHRG